MSIEKEQVTGGIKNFLYILVAAGAGISAVAPMIDWDKAELSITFLAPVAWAFIRAVIIQWNEQRPDWAKGKNLL
jgi:hypothetical protein